MATELIMLSVYLGFAGVLGTMFRCRMTNIAISFCGLIFLPASLGLPENWFMRVASWLLAIITVMIFLKRPAQLPGWLWGRTFALAYMSGLMVLVAGWGFVSGYIGIGAASSIVGIFATYRLGGKLDY